MKPILLSILLVGCGATVSTTSTTSAEVPSGDGVAPELAIQDIATARCTRELSCGNLSQDEMTTCNSDARAATGGALTAWPCPHGVDPTRLSACLEEVRNSTCGLAATVGDRLASCADRKLCK